MEKINIDIRFLDHILKCIDYLRFKRFDNLSPDEKAREFALIDITIEQLNEMINEAKLQRN